MSKQELILPHGSLPVLRGQTGSTLARYRDDPRAIAYGSLPALSDYAHELIKKDIQIVEATMMLKEKMHLAQEQPEQLAHERRKRQEQRAEEERQAQHQRELNNLRREREIAEARQRIKAQEDYGHLIFEIEQKKRGLELLDIQLSEKERRALFEKTAGDFDQDSTLPEHADEIDDALYLKRGQLNAAGFDTRRVDQVIAARQRK